MINKQARTAVTVLVILLSMTQLVSFAGQFIGIGSHLLPGVHPVMAAGPNILGFDCAYGASADGVPFPSSIVSTSPYTSRDTDGTLETKCQATELADQDGFAHPLVSDNPGGTLSPGSGGGITVDIVITNLNTFINGFDLTVGYDTRVLNAIAIDQTGLPFGGNTDCPASSSSCTLQTASSIDQTNGVVRLAQVLLGVQIGPGSSTCPTTDSMCTGTTQELFRIRFDIVGAGSGALTIPAPGGTDIITRPINVVHTDLNSAVSTDALSNLINAMPMGLGFNASFTFSPRPEVPGSPLTFSAVESCANCTAPFTYNWNFSSLDNAYPATQYKVQMTGPTVTITAPPPVVNRVALTVSDSATPTPHTALAVRRLPLVAISTGTTTLNQGTGGGSWTGQWLGGVVTATSGYTGLWRFCPGTFTNKVVCSSPTVSVSQTGSSMTEINTAGGITFNYAGFYNDTFSISDTAEAQLGPLPTTAIAYFPVNVTGATPTYIVTVTSSNTSPTAGTAITLTATVAYASTYPTGPMFRASQFNYIFDYGDGTPTLSGLGTSSVAASHTYSSGGTFVVKVSARESGTASQITENGYLVLTVAVPTTPLCPTSGSCSFSFTPSTATSGQAVTFTAVASGGTPPYSYSWNFGDQTTGGGVTTSHSYQSAGTYTITLNVTDSKGSIQTLTKSVTIGQSSNGGGGLVSTLTSPLGLAGIAAAIILVIAAVALYTRMRRRRQALGEGSFTIPP